jgi:hypothetical protein
MPRTSDAYAQMAYMTVEQAAANDLSFGQLGLRLGVGMRQAWVIHSILYYPIVGLMNEMATNVDNFAMAICTNDKMDSLELEDPAIVDLCKLFMNQLTAVGYEIYQRPIRSDFTNLPGGGYLVLPSSLYLALKTSGCANAHSAECRILYTTKDLNDADYF